MNDLSINNRIDKNKNLILTSLWHLPHDVLAKLMDDSKYFYALDGQ